MPEPVGNIVRLVPGLIERPAAKPTENATPSEGANGFGRMLASALDSVNDLQQQAAQSQTALMNGEAVELHQVMIQAEQAGLSMDLLLEIRNKLVDGYNELSRMPM